jgi:glutamate-1-semialdehyde 2,1-aminomutase
LVFNGGYHGSVLSFGGRGIPINVPHSWVVGDYNDIPGTAALVERYAADLACILVEPMLGSGGCIPAIPEFLAALRQLATKTGAVLVFDEVMTSRMSVGGEQLRLGIKPDMTTLGKYIGGGMSFGAFGGSRQYMEAYDPRLEGALPHAGTFNNNVFSMAAGHAGLTEIFSASTATDLFGRGERLRKSLNALAAGRDAAMQWTGVGSLMTAHFQRGDIRRPDDLQPRAELRELFHLDMIDRGYYFARRGMIALSLEVGTEECDEFCAAVQDFLDARAPLLVAS